MKPILPHFSLILTALLSVQRVQYTQRGLKAVLIAREDVLIHGIESSWVHVAGGKTEDTPTERLLWKRASDQYLLKNRDCADP